MIGHLKDVAWLWVPKEIPDEHVFRWIISGELARTERADFGGSRIGPLRCIDILFHPFRVTQLLHLLLHLQSKHISQLLYALQLYFLLFELVRTSDL